MARDRQRVGPRLRHALSVSLMGACVLSGASAAASGASAPGVTDAKDGFGFALPSGWYQVSVSAHDRGKVLGSTKGLSAKAKAFLSTAAGEAASKDIKVYAFSTRSDSGGSFPNLNVVIVHAAPTVAQLVSETKSGLGQSGAKSIRSRFVHFPVGGVVETTYYYPIGTSVKLHSMEVAFVRGSNTYITNFASADASITAKVESTVMRSWRFTKKG